MTEVKDAIATMYMEKSTEKINEQERAIMRLKRGCLFVVLLLVASIAFNLAFLFSYIEGGNECENTASQHVMSPTERSDPN